MCVNCLYHSLEHGVFLFTLFVKTAKLLQQAIFGSLQTTATHVSGCCAATHILSICKDCSKTLGKTLFIPRASLRNFRVIKYLIFIF
jgi:hypothetical protein